MASLDNHSFIGLDLCVSICMLTAYTRVLTYLVSLVGSLNHMEE